jgi:cytochrome bd-type quinol oxidase subunit 1
MLKVFFFLLFLAANFVWVLMVVGGLMAWLMPRNAHRNKIILSVSGVLALLLTLAVIERGPDYGGEFGGECRTSRMGESCY